MNATDLIACGAVLLLGGLVAHALSWSCAPVAIGSGAGMALGGLWRLGVRRRADR